MNLSDLKSPYKKKRKRLGRGRASGYGKTAGRGTKGQKARSKVRVGFEGGQTPLISRVPKRGFRNINRVEYQILNVDALNRFEDESVVDLDILKKHNLCKRKLPVKILGDGELKRKLTVKAHAFSKKAKEKIEKMGGKCETASDGVESV